MSNNHHRRVYLLTDDVHYLMTQWAQRHGFAIPSRGFFTMLFGRLQDAVAAAIGDAPSVQVIGADILIDQARTLLAQHAAGLPVVCMDRPLADAVPPELLVPYESTRLVEYRRDHWVKIGHGPRPGCPPLEEQIQRIGQRLGASREIAVLDDVHYEGKSLQDCITRLTKAGLHVRCAIIGIRNEPAVQQPLVDDPEAEHPTEIPEHHLLRYPPGRLIDVVDGRDFLFGCSEGGRVVASGGNGHASPQFRFEYAVPYLHGFGDMEDWASIPHRAALTFTEAALGVASELYRAIEHLSSQPVRMRHIGRWPCSQDGRALNVSPDACIVDVIEEVSVRLRHAEPAAMPAHA
jgi:hypothetical protein